MRRWIVLVACVAVSGAAHAQSRPTVSDFVAAMRKGGVAVRIESKCEKREDDCAASFSIVGGRTASAAISLDKSGRVAGWASMEVGTTRIHAAQFLMAYMVGIGQPKEQTEALFMRALRGSANPACCEFDADDNGTSVMQFVYIKDQ